MPQYFKSHLFLHVTCKKMKAYYIAPISTLPVGGFLAGLDLRQCNLLNQLGQRKYFRKCNKNMQHIFCIYILCYSIMNAKASQTHF